MKLICHLVIAFFAPFVIPNTVCADTPPSVSPTALFTTAEGTQEGVQFSGSAPISVTFLAQPSNLGNYLAYYEWQFFTEGNGQPYMVRYEENTEYVFKKAGAHAVKLLATFVDGSDTVKIECDPIRISVSESRLDMPNAFSPNGDGIHDIYKAKEGYQSIVEFDAYIYNRWGQKLYEWHDPAGGWDGKFNGKDVAQGVYFVVVKAKGADGREYKFKRDVNLLRGYSENDGRY